MTRTRERRWRVGLLAALVLATFGLLYANATLLAATLVPLAYVLYGSVSGLPGDRTLRVERTIESAAAAPGHAVEVTLTVENASGQVLPDVRVIDGVPDPLVVSEGTPRLCATLSPGETRQLSYRVVARRGTYAFDRPVARLRSLAGSERETRALDVAGDDELVSVAPLESGLRQSRTTRGAGPVTADTGGSGLEFHSTRQYHQGDPVSRVDWHHVAKTGEFVTVQYREQRTSRTVLVVDARPVARVAPAPGYPTAVDRGVYAAEQLHASLAGAGVETTVAVVGLAETERVTPDPAGIVWAGSDRQLSPEAAFEAVVRASPAGPGSSHPSAGERATGERDGPARSTRADGGTGIVERLVGSVPPDARVILCSPLVDAWPVGLARALAGDHETVVVSPDPTRVPGRTDGRPGRRIAAVGRQLRLRQLGHTPVTTVDWPVEQPLETALRDAVPALLSHR